MAEQKVTRDKKQKVKKPQNKKGQRKDKKKWLKEIKIRSVADFLGIARFVYEVIRDIFLS